jgi:hypothetical protein
MRNHDAALERTIAEVAAILGDALVRLLLPGAPSQSVDFRETESPHGTAG